MYAYYVDVTINKQIKVDNQLGFVHNSGCLNQHTYMYLRIGRSDFRASMTIFKLTVFSFRQYE